MFFSCFRSWNAKFGVLLFLQFITRNNSCILCLLRSKGRRVLRCNSYFVLKSSGPKTPATGLSLTAVIALICYEIV